MDTCTHRKVFFNTKGKFIDLKGQMKQNSPRKRKSMFVLSAVNIDE